MSQGAHETRYPDWRESPSAVAEGVFYAATASDSIEGEARFHSGPTTRDETSMAVYAKGDFVPDFDYASAFSEVFSELRTVLADRLDADAYDDGDLLLRFVAFDRVDDWSVTLYDEDTETVMETTSFTNLAVGADDEEEEVDEDEADDESAEARPEGLDDDEWAALRERLESDPETLNELLEDN